ncbi:MAG: acyltransferase [Mycobacterium sp.]|nr:MAG: acyltransferase [Mycobacterium sp.]
MVGLGTINEWRPPHGLVTTWTATPAARAAARTAPHSTLAPSYQREQHLRSALAAREAGHTLPRLMVVAWDIAGTCDIGAMTAAINTHVRRHDSYHDWFEFDGAAILRRRIENPDVIAFHPVQFGRMGTEQIRNHALTSTPGTLEWGCITFGVIQHADYFTFYTSVDHLYIDGMSAGLIFFDIHLSYDALTQNPAQQPVTPEIASYRRYAARQHERIARLTLTSPEVREWISFMEGTGGHWPRFPLPLGDVDVTTTGDFLTVDLLDAAGTESFDAACRAAGARFSGGVLACAAQAEHDLTGATTFYGFTPYDTRTPGLDTLTVGWFASLVPISVSIGSGSFPRMARAAQESFDAAKRLAGVPFDRVLQLATPEQLGIVPPERSESMVSFIDVRKLPLAPLFEQTNFGAYGDNLSRGGVNVWITRHADKTTATISFPDNPEARTSVRRYLSALAGAFARIVAPATPPWLEEVAEHANSGQGIPVISKGSV